MPIASSTYFNRSISRLYGMIEGISIDPAKVCTNVLFFAVTKPRMSASELSAALSKRGILASAVDEARIRMLTHHDVSREDCLTASRVIRQVMTA